MGTWGTNGADLRGKGRLQDACPQRPPRSASCPGSGTGGWVAGRGQTCQVSEADWDSRAGLRGETLTVSGGLVLGSHMR